MRIGSRVSKALLDEESGMFAVPNDAPVGTVIAVKTECDGDGYDFTDSVTVRWDNGIIEDLDLQGDGWELDDVTPLCYANIYLYDRAYGGPEEGGWDYDTYTPAEGDWDIEPPRHGHFPTAEEAEKAVDALVAWSEDQNTRRRSPSSVLSEGHFEIRLEAWPAERFPKYKPHYC